jgi:hypothetical protein
MWSNGASTPSRGAGSIDWAKENIDRAELRAAVEKETAVVSIEHKKALAELRESLVGDKEGKLDHIAALKHLHREHRELVEHLIHHIHEAREAAREHERRERR